MFSVTGAHKVSPEQSTGFTQRLRHRLSVVTQIESSLHSDVVLHGESQATVRSVSKSAMRVGIERA